MLQSCLLNWRNYSLSRHIELKRFSLTFKQSTNPAFGEHLNKHVGKYIPVATA